MLSQSPLEHSLTSPNSSQSSLSFSVSLNSSQSLPSSAPHPAVSAVSLTRPSSTSRRLPRTHFARDAPIARVSVVVQRGHLPTYCVHLTRPSPAYRSRRGHRAYCVHLTRPSPAYRSSAIARISVTAGLGLFFLQVGIVDRLFLCISNGICDDLRIAAIFQWGRRPSSSWCGIFIVSFNILKSHSLCFLLPSANDISLPISNVLLRSSRYKSSRRQTKRLGHRRQR